MKHKILTSALLVTFTLPTFTYAQAIETTYPAMHKQSHAQIKKVNGVGSWAVDKLQEKLTDAVGSEIFSALRSGIGFPDDNEKMLSILNDVVNRLEALKTQLDKVETTIMQSEYNVRASRLGTSYHQYRLLAKRVTTLNSNILNKKVTADDAKAITNAIIAETIKLGTKLVTDIGGEFDNDGSYDSLSKVYATVKFRKTNVINKDYFNAIGDQVELYRSYQMIALTLYVDALKAQGKVAEANNILESAMEEEVKNLKVTYPSSETTDFFASKDVNGVKGGNLFYDKQKNLVWDTKYETYGSCKDLNARSSNPKDSFRSPSLDEIRSAMSGMNLSGKYSDAVQKMGFSKADAEGTKMVVFGCRETSNTVCSTVSCHTYRDTEYNWFGEDRSGPWDNYTDGQAQFDRTRNNKGIKTSGFSSLKVRFPNMSN